MASIVFLRLNHYNGSKIATMFEEYASPTIHFRRTADRKNPWLWVVSAVLVYLPVSQENEEKAQDPFQRSPMTLCRVKFRSVISNVQS